MFSLYPLLLASRTLNRLQLSPNSCSPHASLIAHKYIGFLFFLETLILHSSETCFFSSDTPHRTNCLLFFSMFHPPPYLAGRKSDCLFSLAISFSPLPQIPFLFWPQYPSQFSSSVPQRNKIRLAENEINRTPDLPLRYFSKNVPFFLLLPSTNQFAAQTVQ